MHLKKLTLKAFRGFASEVSIDLPETGLVLLKGKSGAGKSSVILGITHGLRYCPFSAKDLQSDLTEEPMQVILETSSPDLAISTGAITSLIHNGTEICRSAKDLDKKLNEIVGLDGDFRALLTYRDQKNPTKFLKLSDTEAKTLLMQLVGLEAFEDRIKAVSEASKKLEAEYDRQKSVTEGMEKFLGTLPTGPSQEDVDFILDQILDLEATYGLELENYSSTVKAKELELEASLADLKAQRDSITQERAVSKAGDIKHVIDGLKDELTECDSLINLSRSDHQKGLDKIHKRIKDSEANSWKLAKQQELLASLEERYNALLNNGKCNSCGQDWQDEETLTKLKASIVETQNYIMKLGPLCWSPEAREWWIKDYPEFEVDPILETKKLNISNKLAELQQKLGQEQSLIGIFEADKRSKLLELNSRISNEQAKFVKWAESIRPKYPDELQVLKMAEMKTTQDHKAYQKALDAYQDRQVQLLTAKSDAELIRSSLYEELDALELLKGFVGKIFEEILAEIANEANRILSNLPNTSDVTIEFLTEKEQSNGKIKGSITPVIRFGGKIRKLKAGASGGMENAIELAVDLALANVVGTRTGIKLNYLLLDEPLNGLDTEVCESVLTMLAEYAKTCLVVLVSHASETQALFDKVLEVTYSNQSEVKWL